MKHPKIWSALKQFFYEKDYDNKLSKDSNILADEAYAAITSILDGVKVPETFKDKYVTIGGISYKLEEIKK